MHAIKKLTPLLLLFTPVVSNAALLYTSTFTDNGNLVTETRTYTDHTETWEWLDLTITNGIYYSSIAADVADGILGNSSLSGSAGGIADVTALSSELTGGWSIASDQNVVELFNSFFGLSLNAGQEHNFGSNTPLIETFIMYFGDTYHDFYEDEQLPTTDVEPGLPNYGYTRGFTSSTIQHPNLGAIPKLAIVYDGQYAQSHGDIEDDWISNLYSTTSQYHAGTGTWLTRLRSVDQQAVSISEPGSFALFTLALMGMLSGRFRQRLPRL